MAIKEKEIKDLILNSIPDAELKSKPHVNVANLFTCFDAIAVIDPESIPPER